jgi:hypothetical protein
MTATPRRTFVAGLDLGQVSDFSALAVLERTEGQDRKRHYACRHLQRWALGTPYVGADGGAGIAEDTAALVRKLPAETTLVVDMTGVGRAVYDALRAAGLRAGRMVAATITAGFGPGTYPPGGYGWTVPKRTLASSLQAVLGTRRLKVAPSLPLAAELTRELENFSVKINLATGAESFEAWREKEKDDIVLAVCLAVWWGEMGDKRVIFGC